MSVFAAVDDHRCGEAVQLSGCGAKGKRCLTAI